MFGGKNETPHCSFCRKPEHVVGDLISSPTNDRVYICSECVAVCNGILDHRSRGKDGPSIGPEDDAPVPD